MPTPPHWPDWLTEINHGPWTARVPTLYRLGEWTEDPQTDSDRHKGYAVQWPVPLPVSVFPSSLSLGYDWSFPSSLQCTSLASGQSRDGGLPFDTTTVCAFKECSIMEAPLGPPCSPGPLFILKFPVFWNCVLDTVSSDSSRWCALSLYFSFSYMLIF